MTRCRVTVHSNRIAVGHQLAWLHHVAPAQQRLKLPDNARGVRVERNHVTRGVSRGPSASLDEVFTARPRSFSVKVAVSEQRVK